MSTGETFYVSDLFADSDIKNKVTYTFHANESGNVFLSMKPKEGVSFKNMVIDQRYFPYKQKDGSEIQLKVDVFYVDFPYVQNLTIENCSASKFSIHLENINFYAKVLDKQGCNIGGANQNFVYEQKFSKKHKNSYLVKDL